MPSFTSLNYGELNTDLGNTNYIKGLFLLILAVIGNYVGETLGCETRKLLTKNMLIKQFIILLMIYFTISFSGNVGQNPVFIMKQTVLLWAFFLMFTKMNIQFTITIFCFMAILYIIENFH